jgi:hypothetical protein
MTLKGGRRSSKLLNITIDGRGGVTATEATCTNLCLTIRRSHRNRQQGDSAAFDLSTTQRYLGKITDTEAMRWIENLYA